MRKVFALRMCPVCVVGVVGLQPIVRWENEKMAKRPLVENLRRGQYLVVGQGTQLPFASAFAF